MSEHSPSNRWKPEGQGWNHTILNPKQYGLLKEVQCDHNDGLVSVWIKPNGHMILFPENGP